MRLILFSFKFLLFCIFFVLHFFLLLFLFSKVNLFINIVLDFFFCCFIKMLYMCKNSLMQFIHFFKTIFIDFPVYCVHYTR
ncbi:hypothetical protein ACP87_10945 [Pseudomonas oleovorans]|nr:hypothetical protein [Pseudomonas oleovorans]MBN7131845.1 hypothetical protein [Pseudomonas oleovorans]MBN7139860.1 hypothetical protein [Pseudomonas oleovorans]